MLITFTNGDLTGSVYVELCPAGTNGSSSYTCRVECPVVNSTVVRDISGAQPNSPVSLFVVGGSEVSAFVLDAVNATRTVLRPAVGAYSQAWVMGVSPLPCYVTAWNGAAVNNNNKFSETATFLPPPWHGTVQLNIGPQNHAGVVVDAAYPLSYSAAVPSFFTPTSGPTDGSSVTLSGTGFGPAPSVGIQWGTWACSLAVNDAFSGGGNLFFSLLNTSVPELVAISSAASAVVAESPSISAAGCVNALLGENYGYGPSGHNEFGPHTVSLVYVGVNDVTPRPCGWGPDAAPYPAPPFASTSWTDTSVSCSTPEGVSGMANTVLLNHSLLTVYPALNTSMLVVKGPSSATYTYSPIYISNVTAQGGLWGTDGGYVVNISGYSLSRLLTPTPIASSSGIPSTTSSPSSTSSPGTPSASLSPNKTPSTTASGTGSSSQSGSTTGTSYQSRTITGTSSASLSSGATDSSSMTPTMTATVTSSGTMTSTSTTTSSLTPSATPTGTNTPSATSGASNTTSQSATPTASCTASSGGTSTMTATSSASASYDPNASPGSTASSSVTVSMTSSMTTSSSPTPSVPPAPTARPVSAGNDWSVKVVVSPMHDMGLVGFEVRVMIPRAVCTLGVHREIRWRIV